jgi:hypothetical protein
MLTLCPHCGTPNTHKFGKLAMCSKCKKRLPFHLPRKLIYALRTAAKPALVLAFILTVAFGLPAYRDYRQNQKVQAWLSSKASSGNNLPASHTPR